MLPLDVDTLIDDFDMSSLGPLVIERRTAPTLSARGAYVPAAPTLINRRPWVAHTAGGRMLLQVPENDQNKETQCFYLKSFRLYVADDNRPPDVIRYDSRRWRVVTVHNYGPQGRSTFAMAVLVNTQENA